ncbi:unknown [Clostridium sp. CAG:710]|nr:unknown [Clostridium sp. CAG:710]
MENMATLNTSNEGKSNKIFGVILTESKGTIQKILEKTIKAHTTINKIQIKMTPVVLKVTSILVPGTAPVILPLYNFLKTDQGKKMLEMGLINQEIIREYASGNKEAAAEMLESNLDIITGDDGVTMLNDFAGAVAKSVNAGGGKSR